MWPPGSPTACPPPHMSLGRASCSLTMGPCPLPLLPTLPTGDSGGCLTWPWQGRTPSHEAAHKRQGQTGLGYEVIWPHLQVRPLTCSSLHSSPDGLFRGPLSIAGGRVPGPNHRKGKTVTQRAEGHRPFPTCPQATTERRCQVKAERPSYVLLQIRNKMLDMSEPCGMLLKTLPGCIQLNGITWTLPVLNAFLKKCKPFLHN